MEIGCKMNSHGLIVRGNTDFRLENIDASEMRSLQTAIASVRLGPEAPLSDSQPGYPTMRCSCMRVAPSSAAVMVPVTVFIVVAGIRAE